LHSGHANFLFICQRGNPANKRFSGRLPALPGHWIIRPSLAFSSIWESTSLWDGKSKPGSPTTTYVMSVTASQYDANVIFRS